MKPSDVFELRREFIRETAIRYRTKNPRVFGSVLHGTDVEGSDLDILVDALPGATLFDLGGLQDTLQQSLGIDVQVLTPSELPAKFKEKVLADAMPV